MAVSQINESAKSPRRKRDPTASVTNRLSANQTAERYNKRVSILFTYVKMRMRSSKLIGMAASQIRKERISKIHTRT